MDKNKKLTGQPVLSQILNCIPKKTISDAAKQYQSNRYYKQLPVRVHLITMLYGVFSYCNGLRELCEGMLGCEGKLSQLGLNKAPSRSTLSDANTRRSYRVFESIYYQLLHQYHSFISDSRLKGLSIKNLKIIDSTTMSLFTDILRGVGRNPLDGSRKKGGIKVHSLMDAFSGVTEFVRMTAAKVHDKQFLRYLKLPSESFVVFDKGYNMYLQYAKWTKQKVWFVTRMKNNAVFHVNKVIVDNTRKKNTKGVIKEQYISISYKDGEGVDCRLKLRRIIFKADDGKVFYFITNNFKISNKEIALIYKNRWMIETLFKQIKQNFPVRYFWGESANAIKIQIFCVLIAQLLMVVIRKISKTKKSFANMITVIRLHLMSYVAIDEFMKDTYKAWRMANPPPLLKLNLQ